MQPSSVHVQSMAVAMAELTHQNQELTREIHLKRQQYEAYGEEQDQNQGDEKSVVPESQSRGTTSRRAPHLEREIDQMRKVMDKMRENMRRTNPIEDLVHHTDSPFTASIMVTPCLQNLRCLPWIRTMDRVTRLMTLLLLRLQCTFRASLMKLCVEPSLLLSKVQHEYGSVKYPRIR